MIRNSRDTRNYSHQNESLSSHSSKGIHLRESSFYAAMRRKASSTNNQNQNQRLPRQKKIRLQNQKVRHFHRHLRDGSTHLSSRFDQELDSHISDNRKPPYNEYDSFQKTATAAGDAASPPPSHLHARASGMNCVPLNTPFYYGWIIIVICSLAIFYSAAGETFGLAVFFPEIMLELGLSQPIVDVLFMISSFFAAFVAVPIGFAYSRYSPTRIVAGFLLLMSLSCVVMAMSRSLLVASIGLFGMRSAAQSVLYVGNIIIVSHWFHKRRGTALGVTGFLHILLCVNGFPPLARLWINAFGWRGAYWANAALGLFFILPLFLVLAYDDPRRIGVDVDGIVKNEELVDLNNTQDDANVIDTVAVSERADSNSHKVLENVQVSRTRSLVNSVFELIRSSVWWLYVLSNLSLSLISSALQIHLRAMFEEKNMLVSVDLAVFLALGLAYATIQLFGGYIVDKLSPHFAIGTALVAAGFTLVLGALASTLTAAIIFGLLLGVSEGSLRIATNSAWPKYFALPKLGLLQSTSNFAAILGQSVGPLVLSSMLAALKGTHSAALLVLLTFPLCAIVSVVVCKLRHSKRCNFTNVREENVFNHSDDL